MSNEEYICKIPTMEEINKRLEHATILEVNNRNTWRNNIIQDATSKKSITYYGIMNGEVVSEATASISQESFYVKDSKQLIDQDMAYLSAFMTNKEYRNNGFFSRLFQYMIEDLKKKGYTKFTIGVKKDDYLNKSIYLKYGFTKFIKSLIMEYPNGEQNEVEYYLKIV